MPVSGIYGLKMKKYRCNIYIWNKIKRLDFLVKMIREAEETDDVHFIDHGREE